MKQFARLKTIFLFSFILFFSFAPFQAGYAQTILSRVKGFILLQVEQRGEAWYVHPVQGERYYMKDGATAYQMMRSFGLGITDKDLIKIPSVSDTTEMKFSSSLCSANLLASRLKGRILLQVQQRGEAWYVHPQKCRRIYMKDGEAAHTVMRFLGLGITDNDLLTIPVGTLQLQPPPPLTPISSPTPSPTPVPDGQRPIARVTSPIVVMADALQINLDGQASSDPQNDPLTYKWTLVSGPSGAFWQNDSIAQPTLSLAKDLSFADTYALAFDYVIQLIVSDGVNFSEPVLVNLKVNFQTSFEQKMLEKVNALRVSRGTGLPLLKLDQKLTWAARKYTRYMRSNNWFNHVNKEGENFDKRVSAEGYQWKEVGENIGVVKSSLNDLVLNDAMVEMLFEGWKNSPDHFANMVRAGFKEIGVGYSIGPVSDPEFPFQFYAAQEFGTQFSQ